MEPHTSLEHEGCTHPQDVRVVENNCCGTPFTQNSNGQPPDSNKAKRPTRQWAAWTRQEEEMFFNALRQFGKNFEKITKRVQSKNKDQVRHYYYRLVRRMNKLLGPGLCLDAKNSKDTNAAMLRWWSLLEKQSCKSSKLHLKPRRFKIFVETLENQLLKDRKKCKRRQSSQGENCLPTIPTVISNLGRASAHDSPPVRLVLVDSKNIQQSNSAKEASIKRHANAGCNRRICKSDSSPVNIVKQRRKPATASTAAFKRWEKAAIAGVSLVADAAEHLERTAIGKDFDQGPKAFDPTCRDVPSCSAPQNSIAESNSQPLVKLKLQLFPIDEGTRKALEMDNHNPYLELTLSTRKRISSVLEHLKRKWRNSNVASAELMLFPYYAQSENLKGYRRWTQDSVLSALDVYVLVGSPSVFRLRYGWFSNAELASATFGSHLVSSGIMSNLNANVNDAKEQIKDPMEAPAPSSDRQSTNNSEHRDKDQQILGDKIIDAEPSPTEMPNEICAGNGMDTNNTLAQSSVFCDRRETSNGAVLKGGFSKDDIQLRNGDSVSAGEWADSLTNISIGDLLSEVSHNIDDSIDPLPLGCSQFSQQGPFSCDSFDAAIAAHIYRHQNKTSSPSALPPFGSSIWEAEETCDAFAFRNFVPQNEVHGTIPIASSEACHKIVGTSLAGLGANIQESREADLPVGFEPFIDEPVQECALDEEIEEDHTADRCPLDNCQSDPFVLEISARNCNGLTDLCWPESLGPLDLDIPTCKYNSQDLILSDSLSGFNRLLGNSLDAFQNCSFFGFDKKETLSTVDTKDATSFSDYKIGSRVTDFAKA